MASPILTSKTHLSDYGEAYPKSQKIYEGTGRIRVPMREVTLSGGEPPVRLYDTSGPSGIDPRLGLPPVRRDWVDERGGVDQVRDVSAQLEGVPETLQRPVLRGRGPVTQLHYARKGIVTSEME